jgi:hypothetical protein
VTGELRGLSGRDQDGNGDETSVARRQLEPPPHIAEQHVVSERGKTRRDPWLHCSRRSGRRRLTRSLLLLPGLDRTVVLLVAHLFQPLHSAAVAVLGDCDMCHRRAGRRAVPVLLACRDPNDVADADFFDRLTPSLNAADTGRDD